MRGGSKTKWMVITLVIIVVLSTFVLGAFLYAHNLREEELRESIITNCEKNGNPIREVLQHRIQKEIKNDENNGLLKKLLPDVTQKDLEFFAAKAVNELQLEEIEIRPVDCQKIYEH